MRSSLLAGLFLTSTAALAVGCGRSALDLDPLSSDVGPSSGGGLGGEGGGFGGNGGNSGHGGFGGDGGFGGNGGDGGDAGAGGCDAPEVCDGVDNNCNGLIDEGDPGGGFMCSTGAPGVCAFGVSSCNNGKIACFPSQTPTAETCNGLDDDCDGIVDNGVSMCGCTSAFFGGHTYLFCPTASAWGAALEACKSANLNLVSLESPGEENFVFTKANTISSDKWWIGLNDLAKEGQFVWQGGTPLGYTDWAAGEPNDAGGNEDCGQINRYYPDKTWNDEPCDEPLFFICESP